MAIIVCILLMLLGALAASNMIIARRPDAAVQLDKIRPYQGYMGVVALVIALLDIPGVFHMLAAFSLVPILSLFAVISWLTLLLLGLFFSYDLIQTKLLKDKPDATLKLAETQAKIARIQIPLGIAGIVIGIIALLLSLIY